MKTIKALRTKEGYLDEHIKELKYDTYIPTTWAGIEKTLIFFESHFVPEDIPLVDEDEPSNITLNDIYIEKHALDTIITKLKNYETNILYLKLRGRTTKILKKVRTTIAMAEYHRITWDSVKSSDKPSTSTKSTFSGIIGAMWYDEPLERFLEQTLNTEFTSGDKYWKPTTMKGLLDLLMHYYGEVEHITIGKLSKDKNWTVPKHILIALIQQLIIIEVNRILPYDSPKVRMMKGERLNRATFKIHTGYQLNTQKMVKLFTRHNLMNCDYRKILDRSSNEMMKDPPKWVKNTIADDVKKHATSVTFTKNIKIYQVLRIALKKKFLKESYGKRASMSDEAQDKFFTFNLEQHHSKQSTRLRHLNMEEYDKYYKLVTIK